MTYGLKLPDPQGQVLWISVASTAVADLLRIWAPLAEVIDGSWPDLEAGPVIRRPQEAPGESRLGLKSHLI